MWLGWSGIRVAGFSLQHGVNAVRFPVLMFHLKGLTYLLTPWCRVLLDQLTGLQLVKKFPAFHGTPKVHYRTHKRPPPVSILGQPNPVHTPTSHLLENHPNITHPSTPRSPQWFLSLRFPHQDPIHPVLLTHTHHMPNPFVVYKVKSPSKKYAFAAVNTRTLTV